MSDAALMYAIDLAKSMNMKIRRVRIIPSILDVSSMSHWREAQRRRIRKDMKLMRKRVHNLEYKNFKSKISLINSKGIEGSALAIEGTDVVRKIIEIIKKEK